MANFHTCEGLQQLVTVLCETTRDAVVALQPTCSSWVSRLHLYFGVQWLGSFCSGRKVVISKLHLCASLFAKTNVDLLSMCWRE